MKLKLLILIGCAWASLLNLNVAGATERPPFLRIPRIAGTITADGRMNEPAWRKAAWVVLRDNQTGETPAERTEAQVWHNGKFLFVGFACVDTDVAATMLEKDADLWKEEVVEIFLDPEGRGHEYLEVEVNPLGAWFDAWVEFDTNIDFQKAVRFDLPGIQLGVSVDGTLNDTEPDTGWTCEIGIPLAALPQGVSSRSRLNFTRIDRVSGRHVYQAWAPTRRWFHVPEKFGRAVFR